MEGREAFRTAPLLVAEPGGGGRRGGAGAALRLECAAALSAAGDGGPGPALVAASADGSLLTLAPVATASSSASSAASSAASSPGAGTAGRGRWEVKERREGWLREGRRRGRLLGLLVLERAGLLVSWSKADGCWLHTYPGLEPVGGGSQPGLLPRSKGALAAKVDPRDDHPETLVVAAKHRLLFYRIRPGALEEVREVVSAAPSAVSGPLPFPSRPWPRRRG